MEDNPGAGLLPNPTDKDPTTVGVEEAESQEKFR